MAFTNETILETALEQSAWDAGCEPEDFLRKDNVTVISKPDSRARKYLELPFYCNFISYGNNVVASVSPQYADIAKAYINRLSPEHCFETPGIYILNNALARCNLRVCHMAEYFLPRLEHLKLHSCNYEIKILGSRDFSQLYTPEWSNALCEKRKELDVLGVGAYDRGTLAGLAACSADGENMWQIGIDVLPQYRRQGVAAALTSRLAAEILNCGKIPFYCAAWANIKSVRNAIKCGFRPAWAELTVKPAEFINEMNK